MGLKESFQSAAVTAVKAFGNVGEVVTLRHYTGQQRVAGKISATYVEYTPRVLFADLDTENHGLFSGRHTPETVKKTDRVMYLPGSAMPVQPTDGDLVTRINGEEYSVEDKNIPPADALITVYLKQKKQ